MSWGQPAALVHSDVSGIGRLAIVTTRWNSELIETMLADASRVLAELGISEASQRLKIYRVSGAFELPLAARWLSESGRYGAIIALGAVVRGETPHFEYVCSACSDGIVKVMLEYGIPVAFGVLTTDNMEQARQRARTKGREAVDAALEMALLRQTLNHSDQ